MGTARDAAIAASLMCSIDDFLIPAGPIKFIRNSNITHDECTTTGRACMYSIYTRKLVYMLH